MSWEIRAGDALERLKEIPDESVHCCVTSPPYWRLRDYGVEGQLGLEETPDEFVEALVEVLREVRRALSADGTLWLNIGDSYAGSWGAQGHREGGGGRDRHRVRNHPKLAFGAGALPRAKLKPKDQIGIPWMTAFALRADGWYLRRDVIWSKPNPTPESVEDRPTSAHEYVFLLSKSPRYFYDYAAVRDKAVSTRSSRNRYRPAAVAGKSCQQSLHPWSDIGGGRNRRSVWEIPEEAWSQFLRWLAEQPPEQLDVWDIPTRPFPDAHFATFPTDLAEPCVLAGTSPRVCGNCGAPWRAVSDVTYENPGNRRTNGPRSAARRGERFGTPGFSRRLEKRVRTVGRTPTCDHGGDPTTALVLDPFAGAATTGLVTAQHGRDFLGIELNPEYVELGERRIRRWEANPAGRLRGDPVPLDGQTSFDELLTKEAA